jgi:hypothetical protein
VKTCNVELCVVDSDEARHNEEEGKVFSPIRHYTRAKVGFSFCYFASVLMQNKTILLDKFVLICQKDLSTGDEEVPDNWNIRISVNLRISTRVP